MIFQYLGNTISRENFQCTDACNSHRFFTPSIVRGGIISRVEKRNLKARLLAVTATSMISKINLEMETVMETVSGKGKVRVNILPELLLSNVNMYRFGWSRWMHLKKNGVNIENTVTGVKGQCLDHWMKQNKVFSERRKVSSNASKSSYFYSPLCGSESIRGLKTLPRLPAIWQHQAVCGAALWWVFTFRVRFMMVCLKELF